jgi:hypothetical protein
MVRYCIGAKVWLAKHPRIAGAICTNCWKKPKHVKGFYLGNDKTLSLIKQKIAYATLQFPF